MMEGEFQEDFSLLAPKTKKLMNSHLTKANLLKKHYKIQTKRAVMFMRIIDK